MAVFGYPKFLNIHPISLTLNQIIPHHFTPILGVVVLSRISFYPILVYFELFLAVFRYPGFLKYFSIVILCWCTSRYTILHLFWDDKFSPESDFTQFGLFWAILGWFWPFLGTQGSSLFFPELPKVDVHQDITIYIYFSDYRSLQNLILPNFGLFWAVFGYFWAHRVPEFFPLNYLTLKYIKI